MTVRLDYPQRLPGASFIRCAIALGLARGDRHEAIEIASERYPDQPLIAATLKGAIDAGTMADSGWAVPLAALNPLASEYVNVERGETVLGRMPGVRRVPPRTSFVSGGGSAMAWLGEGSPIPASANSFTTDSMGVAKLGGIQVVTRELAELSDPRAELLIRNDLIAASVAYQDAALVSPDAAVANVSPAGLLNGIEPVISTGTTPATIAANFNSALQMIADAGVTLRQPVVVMTPSTAATLATMRDTAGGSAFPLITATGGSLFGMPVITSPSVPHSTSGGSLIAIVETNEVQVTDAGAEISTSGEAALQLSDAPDPGAAQLVSLFAANLLGIKLVRYCSWRLRRAGAAAYIDGFGS